MTRPRLEVAEVIRSCRDAFLRGYGANLTPEQRRVLDDLAACRTAALGGHVLECPECGHQEIAYNSCGNRHCPKCQGTAAARWLEAQAADLLDMPYFHVVFTLPRALDPIALHNPREVYGLLMRAAAETLLEVAADPQHLGAEVGVLAVLHTWGQNLALHPHVHCVVTGGGLVARRAPLGRLPARLLPAGPRAQPGVPGQVPGRAPRRLQPRAAPLPGRAGSRWPSVGAVRMRCSRRRCGRTGSSMPSRRSAAPRRS